MTFLDYINEDVKKVLLIDPKFPISNKSRNHSDLLPVGLLKIGALLKKLGIETKLVRLNFDFNIDDLINFNPDLVMITSVFTYWAHHVRDAVTFSKQLWPSTQVIVGGVYASLCPGNCKQFTRCDAVIEGIIPGAECIPPDYSLLGEDAENIDYQIIHSTRGCVRKCGFCGVYKIEPKFMSKSSIRNEIIRKRLIFYDNNLLANEYIEDLLNELISLKDEKIINRCESQSGFDGRILRKNQELAHLLKKANFKDPKIAWDGSVKSAKKRKEEIDVLVNAGYNPKEIAVFMIYNADLDYNELEEKRALCFKWGVQVSDCRYRPLNRLDDNYNPYAKKPQTNEEYHINPNWTDEEVRQFRRNVRRHNICIRHNMSYHSRKAELKKISKEDSMRFREMDYEEAKEYLSDAWSPAIPHYIQIKDKQSTL